MFNPRDIQKDFPILSRKVHDSKRLVYLDNAATSQKPQVVIDAITKYYTQHNANVHRGVHQLGDESTKLFHESRANVAEFFGADADELVTVNNTTEAINQVAYTWGEAHISQGDVILTTEMEHHSNIVPWQELAKRKEATVEYISVLDDGHLDRDDFTRKCKNQHLKLIAMTHVSNAVGIRNPLEEMIAESHRVNPQVRWLVDGAQAAPHFTVNFHQLGADFYTVSAHKMLGQQPAVT